MGVKLGNTDASLYLGSTPVAAYLGGTQVYSAAATLYFNAAVDNDWDEVGNWWLDDEHTQAAGRLPAAADSVVATASITASGQTVVNFTVSGSTEVNGSFTVTGLATFQGSCSCGALGASTLNGNATFNDLAYLAPLGTVNGNVTFNDSSGSEGVVNGDATFNDSSFNDGTVTGTITDNR
jgi:hypothetical protein